MRTNRRPEPGGSIDLSVLFSACRKYATKPRDAGNGMVAYEIVTITSRQFVGFSPPAEEILDPLPSGLEWIKP